MRFCLLPSPLATPALARALAAALADRGHQVVAVEAGGLDTDPFALVRIADGPAAPVRPASVAVTGGEVAAIAHLEVGLTD